MKNPLPWFWRVLAGGLLLAMLGQWLPVARASDLPAAPATVPEATDHSVRKILFFYRCTTYLDPVLWATNGQPGLVETVLGDVGKANHLAFTFTQDGSVFTPESLAHYDAVCFFTSGDLTAPGNDGNPPMTLAGKAALLQAIADGLGFVGIHSAAATFASGPDGVDPYVKMLGGELLNRVRGLEPAHQIVADTNFPGLAAVPADYCPVEEWYSLRNFAPNLHVLLVMDTANMVRGAYYAPNYPTTWARRYGRGRVFYTSLGHEAAVWNSPVFRQILTGGLRWAAGTVDAVVSPNMARVTPGVSLAPAGEPDGKLENVPGH